MKKNLAQTILNKVRGNFTTFHSSKNAVIPQIYKLAFALCCILTKTRFTSDELTFQNKKV